MKLTLVWFSLALASLSVAKVAPPFQADLMGGGKVEMKQRLKPGRVLLLSFWASWCTPCIEELNQVTKHMKEDAKLPVDLLTVNVDTSETTTDVKPTLKLYRFDFPVILDPKHEIFGRYQDQKTLPFSVLIGPSGNIEATFSGYHEEMFKKIREIASGKST